MLWLVKKIVFGHIHTWEDVECWTLTISGGTARGTRVHSRCTTCGSHRKWDLI